MEATTASLVHRGLKRMAPTIKTGGRALLLAFTTYASTLCAQTPASPPFQPPQTAAPQPATSLLQQPAREAQIDLRGDTLYIRADNSSLTAILHQIASKSGMQIEGLSADERVFGSFGPGAPRDVLADLLNGTAYNLVLLGDLSDGAPRQLILTPATRTGATPVPAPTTPANADETEQESVEQPPAEVQQPPTPPPGAPGVRTPQQLFEQLQRMRQAQQQGGQQPGNTSGDQPQQQTTPPSQQQ
jgi:hypothetical protein